MPPQDSGSTFAKAAGTSAASIGVVFLTFLSGVLVSRMLGPEARGEYGSIMLIAQTAFSLASLSYFDGVVVELRSRAGAEGENVYGYLTSTLLAALILTLSAGVILTGLLPLLNASLEEVSDFQFILVTVSIIATTYFSSAFISLERSRMRFTLFNMSRLVSPGLFSLLIVVFWASGREGFSVFLATVLFIIAQVPVVLLWAWHFRRHLFSSVRPQFMREAGKTGLRLHVAFALTALSGGMDRLIGVAAWDNAVLGQYFVAFSAVGAGFGVISSSLTVILLPYLAATPKEERPVRINQILRLTFLASVVFVAIGFVALPVLIPLLYGGAFSPAIRLALLLLVAMLVQPLRAVVVQASRSLGHAMPSTVIALTSIVTLWLGYLFTGYRNPELLIAYLGLANVLSTLIGAGNLYRTRDLHLDRTLLPGPADLALLKRAIAIILGRGNDTTQ